METKQLHKRGASTWEILNIAINIGSAISSPRHTGLTHWAQGSPSMPCPALVASGVGLTISL